VLVRPCGQDDVDQVTRLAGLMGRAGPDAEVAERIHRIGTLPDHLLCVAGRGGGLIGYAWAQDYGPHLRTGEALVRIHDLFVEPGVRRRGVGKELFTHVRRWAARRGAAYIQWQASQEALPFYAALEFAGDPCPDPEHPFFEIILSPRDG